MNKRKRIRLPPRESSPSALAWYFFLVCFSELQNNGKPFFYEFQVVLLLSKTKIYYSISLKSPNKKTFLLLLLINFQLRRSADNPILE